MLAVIESAAAMRWMLTKCSKSCPLICGEVQSVIKDKSLILQRWAVMLNCLLKVLYCHIATVLLWSFPSDYLLCHEDTLQYKMHVRQKSHKKFEHCCRRVLWCCTSCLGGKESNRLEWTLTHCVFLMESELRHPVNLQFKSTGSQPFGYTSAPFLRFHCGSLKLVSCRIFFFFCSIRGSWKVSGNEWGQKGEVRLDEIMMPVLILPQMNVFSNH